MCWDNSLRVPQAGGEGSPAEGAVASPQFPSAVGGLAVPGFAVPGFAVPGFSFSQGFPNFSNQFPALGQALPPHHGIPKAAQGFQHSLSHLYCLKRPLQALSGSENVSLPSEDGVSSLTDERPAKRIAFPVEDLQFMDEDADVDVFEEEDDLTEAVPDECLASILSLVPDVADRMSCALVCRRWLHVLSLAKRRDQTPHPAALASASGIKRINPSAHAAAAKAEKEPASGLSRTLEGRSACDARLMAMSLALADKGGLEKLVIRATGRPSDVDEGRRASTLPLTASGIQAVAQISPNLRSVALWDCSWLDDEAVVVIARHCRNLEKLDIMNCPRISDRSLMALARYCPRLSVLSLTLCSMVSDAGLAFLAKGCKVLTALSLTSCPRVVGKGLAALGSACKKLTALKLAGSLGLTDEGFRAAAEAMTSVQRLRLHQLPKLSEDGLKALGSASGFQNVSGLSISSCSNLTSACLEVIGAGCAGLKCVSLANCTKVTDDGILFLLRGAQKLESVVLQSLPGITNTSARHALEHGGSLRSLAIAGCPGVKEAAANGDQWTFKCQDMSCLKLSDCQEIGDHCLASMSGVGSTLSSLDLCGLPRAGDAGVLAFLRKSTSNLSSVDLSGCAQITDKVVVSIAEHCGDNIRSLNLDGCTRVTDKSLRALAKGCISLEDLDLSRCDVTDRGLKGFLNAAGHSLVNLSLSGCARITDKTVEEIVFSCHSLSGLNLKNCSRLSKAAVERLKLQAVSLFGPSCLFIDP